MTVKELAGYLQLHPSSVYRVVTRQGLPAFKIGSDWRFRKVDIDEWMRQKTEHQIRKVH